MNVATITSIAFICTVYCINNANANKNPPPYDQKGRYYKCDGVTCDGSGQCASTAGKHRVRTSRHGCYGSRNEITNQVEYSCHTVQSTVCDSITRQYCGIDQQCLTCEPQHRTRSGQKCCYTSCVQSCEKDKNGNKIDSTCTTESCPHAGKHVTCGCTNSRGAIEVCDLGDMCWQNRDCPINSKCIRNRCVCNANYYQDNNICTACPYGQQSNSGSVGVKSCTCGPNRHLNYQKKCECNVGYYQYNGGCISCNTYKSSATKERANSCNNNNNKNDNYHNDYDNDSSSSGTVYLILFYVAAGVCGLCVTGCCWYRSVQKTRKMNEQRMQMRAVQIAPIHQFPAAQQLGPVRHVVGPNGQISMVMTVPVPQQSKIIRANGFFQNEISTNLKRDQNLATNLKRDRSLATSMIEEGSRHSAAMDQKISKTRRESQVRLEKRRAERKK